MSTLAMAGSKSAPPHVVEPPSHIERHKNEWYKPDPPPPPHSTFRDHLMGGYGVAQRVGGAAQHAFMIGRAAYGIASEMAPYVAAFL